MMARMPKFKARPSNKMILEAPTMPVLPRSAPQPPEFKVMSSQELEQEELDKIPKFKARPLNKKIFESKGEMGISCNTKCNVTIPQEFHLLPQLQIFLTSFHCILSLAMIIRFQE